MSRGGFPKVVFRSLLCLCMCSCTTHSCVLVHLHMCAYGYGGQDRVIPQEQSRRPDWLGESPGILCLCLPRTGVTSVYHHFGILSNFGSGITALSFWLLPKLPLQAKDSHLQSFPRAMCVLQRNVRSKHNEKMFCSFLHPSLCCRILVSAPLSLSSG